MALASKVHCLMKHNVLSPPHASVQLIILWYFSRNVWPWYGRHLLFSPPRHHGSSLDLNSLLRCRTAVFPVSRGSFWHTLCSVFIPKQGDMSCSCRGSQKETRQGRPNMVKRATSLILCKRGGSKATL